MQSTTKAKVRTGDVSQLNWDVLVTPGIPIATSDLPPGMKQAMFQAIASTLIYGKQDAVLVDAYMTVKQSNFKKKNGRRKWYDELRGANKRHTD